VKSIKRNNIRPNNLCHALLSARILGDAACAQLSAR